MKRLTVIAALAGTLLAASPVGAQEGIELPEYTDQERWERLAFLTLGWEAAVVALGEHHGMSPQEVGDWVGEFFATGWLGGTEASQLFLGMYRNHMSMPGASAEVVSTTPTSVVARFNRPGDTFLGAGGRANGVEGADIDVMFRALNGVIADWVGVHMELTREGDHDVFTLETEYGPIHASDRIRWNRGSFLSWLTSLELMSLRMESGMSAREVGEAAAELYAPSWTARTPWRLYRGMVWNQMSDPNTDCEVISASPEEVRARCRQHYRELVEQQSERFGVTPDDVFESGRAFAEGVAEHLGMRWTEQLEGEYRMITVSRP